MQSYKKSKQDERQFWREFLKLYRALPELWKVKSEGYRNRFRRNKAYQLLIAKMKKFDPRADKASVSAKINSFRSAYRRELRKVQDSMRDDCGADDVYIPTLWFYRDLEFLRHEENESPEPSMLDDAEWKEEHHDSEADETSSQTSQPQATFSNKRKRQDESKTNGEDSRMNELLSLACKRLATPPSETHMLARAWRTDYEKLSPDQQLYAKKFISDILFEGQLGALHRNSVTVNDPPPPQPIITHLQCAPLIGFDPVAPSPSNVAMHEDSRHASGQIKQEHESTPAYPSLLKDEQLID
uniref:Putative alcohol dehydrogenase transcription factor myb/sant-like protein n=1 Tax=Anopheles triannulatus TaxID=58253 RepID=A0A2M4APL3_9DIPT